MQEYAKTHLWQSAISKHFPGEKPPDPAPLGRSRLTWPGKEASDAGGDGWMGKGRKGTGKGLGTVRSLGSRLTLVHRAYETLNPGLPVFKLE